MGPEIPNPGTDTGNAFAEMAASMPAYDAHMANQAGLTPEAPPNEESSSGGETNPANEPKLEQQPSGEQASDNQPNEQSHEEPDNQTIETSSEPTPTPESATQNSAETADFSPDLIADIERYADQLASDAKKDLKMADALHEFAAIAGRQHTAEHQMASSPTLKSAESTESTPVTASGAPKQPATKQPDATPVATPGAVAPDPAAAIAAALAETSNTPIPGQTAIATPAAPPIGNLGSATGEAPLAV